MNDRNWNVGHARELYNIAQWSEGYVDVNAQGHLCARPLGPSDPGAVDLYELARELAGAGLTPPLLVRFTDTLRHRVRSLREAFSRAMRQERYQGDYTPVYPIKVNQQQAVVRAILDAGPPPVGLEAGSKPELLAVLSMAAGARCTVICNGYKDREYVRLALLGRRLGLPVYIVLEKPAELDTVIAQSRSIGVQPLLGVRLRLASVGKGKWQNTGGEKSKFGLTAEQVLALLQRLKDERMLDSLQLMHFHLGSQLANVRDIQVGLREAARYYAELRRRGAPVAIVDVGGGLGVDYEGTSCRSFCSMNYTIQEYANDVVYALAAICRDCDLPHPAIITEAGRAMTAHHAMLITEVTGVAPAPGDRPPPPPEPGEPDIIGELHEAWGRLARRTAVETYHDAGHWLAEARSLFTLGVFDLTQRARAEAIYFAICQRLRGLLSPAIRGHREILDDLNETLADKYVCNFSLFQSLPDAWAIDQVFPVVPLHRLDEAPLRRGVIHDLTCDSDGQIKLYVDGEGIESSLPLHALRPGEPYLIGIFLLGAYQEILGDVHNLFGDTHSVNVELTGAGGYRTLDALHGDSVSDMLRYVHFDPAAVMAGYRTLGTAAELEPHVLQACLEEFKAGLNGYTYLED